MTEDRTGVGEFAVELPVFSGPFRLLAELLLEHRIDVCDVSVAAVTDGFLAHAADAERWDLEEATWFVAVGASLLELKVGRLMPKAADPDEEDLLGGSPDLAYARSLELAAFRTVALDLARRFEDGSRYFAREAGPPEEFAHLYPDVMENVTADQLAAVAAVALRPPPLVDLSHVQPVRATVEEALETMRDRLASLRTAWFRELVADCDERIHVVVRFLALLEMYREGHVELSQAGTFGEIEVRLTAANGAA
ncbi:MAG TPA: ScpA family protein [Actinomycetota bacterium]